MNRVLSTTVFCLSALVLGNLQSTAAQPITGGTTAKVPIVAATGCLTQTADGGWGPFVDAPPEIFDTAIALLTLAQFRDQDDLASAIQRGRSFLIANQNPDGSWPATNDHPSPSERAVCGMKP